jgi:mevalonate kinase
MGCSAFGPGKVILLGEHGVVYGYPALAAPISRGVRAVARPARALELVCPQGLSRLQRQALHLAFAAAARKVKKARVSISLASDLPLSMGLGSSAALSVAVARVLLKAATSKEATTPEVAALALVMEKEFHGTPSGVDHATSACNAMIRFARGEAKAVSSPRPVKVLVALAGARAPTRATVSALRDRQARWRARYRRIFAEIARLVDDGVGMVRRGDLEGLGDVMNMNQGLLAALGLSSEPIEAMVHRLRSLGALGAKLTGAGGDGGAVIGLFLEPERALVPLRRAGVECFTSQLAGPRTP